MTAEAGIDRHDQDQIDLGENFLNRTERGRGIQSHPCLHTSFLDRLYRAMEMWTGFHMHREIVRTSFGELGDEGVGVRYHEMDIERQLSDFSERRHDRRTDGQIRNEMPVHDIDMEEVSPRPFHGRHLVCQSGKVRR